MPPGLDVLLVEQEVMGDDKSALQAVVAAGAPADHCLLANVSGLNLGVSLTCRVQSAILISVGGSRSYVADN